MFFKWLSNICCALAKKRHKVNFKSKRIIELPGVIYEHTSTAVSSIFFLSFFFLFFFSFETIWLFSFYSLHSLFRFVSVCVCVCVCVCEGSTGQGEIGVMNLGHPCLLMRSSLCSSRPLIFRTLSEQNVPTIGKGGAQIDYQLRACE